jgi:hypothetical protein
MRRLLLVLTGVLLIAPQLPSAWELGTAHAANPAKSRAKPSARPAAKKKPVPVKLKNAGPAFEEPPPTSTEGAPVRGPTRLNFEDQLVQGQTNQSGAVYLYDRKELKTRSMIKLRDSFRNEIVGAVYDG